MKIKQRATAMARSFRGICLVAVACLPVSPATAHEGDFAIMAPIVVDPKKSATLPGLMAKLRDERLVYVGETHTALADHLVQLEVLRSMASQAEGLAIGVEWFQSLFQPALDDFLAGRIDEAEMLKRTEYYDRWRFDYRLYRPIVQFAKDNSIPIIALNASKELTSAIHRDGINGLPAGLQDQLPDSYDVNDDAYEAILREMFSMHPKSGDEEAFRRFVEVQLTWDESMAQRVAEYLSGDSSRRMLVLAGKGHIGGRSGIPNRVTRRIGIEGVTIASYHSEEHRFSEADYLVLARDQALPPAGLMRVLLETRDEGVFVTGFTPGSPARTAGVEKGDRLVAINGAEIRHFADVKIAMLDQRPGNEIEVTVQRNASTQEDGTVSLLIALAGRS